MIPMLVTLAGNRSPYRTPATMRMSGEAVNYDNSDIFVGVENALSVESMDQNFPQYDNQARPQTSRAEQIQTINSLPENNAQAYINSQGLQLVDNQ
jgi:hypothetical protein